MLLVVSESDSDVLRCRVPNFFYEAGVVTYLGMVSVVWHDIAFLRDFEEVLTHFYDWCSHIKRGYFWVVLVIFTSSEFQCFAYALDAVVYHLFLGSNATFLER